MAVLLAPDTITVSGVDTALDAHGWAEETGAVPIRTVKGSIQETTPMSDARATDAGGAGPNAPYHQRLATAYLSDGVEPGDALAVRNTEGGYEAWQVQRCYLVEDPRGNRALNVWVAECVEVR